MLYESGEDYLETILILKERMDKLRSVDIANELGYSKASISRAMKILNKSGYIEFDENNYISLTEKGSKRAKDVFDRHNTLSNFFMHILGVDEDIAQKDACKIEHIISDESFEKIKKFTDNNIKPII